MSTQEFLDALSFALCSPDGQIVGFKDITGLIITPSHVCQHPEILRQEAYEVMLKLTAKKQRVPTVIPDPRQGAYIREYDISNNVPPLAKRDQIISPATPISENSSSPNYDYAFGQQQSVVAGSAGVIHYKQSVPQQHVTQSHRIPVVMNVDERRVIATVMQLPQDQILTENMKSRIVNLIQIKDKGILGAFMLYQEDHDLEEFKARIIHKVLTTNVSRGETGIHTSYATHQHLYENNTPQHSSSTSTAGFQYPATAVGGPRRAHSVSNDRYMRTVLKLEKKGLIDDHVGTILKTLILEENTDVYRILNQYFTKLCSEMELGFKLTRVAQKLGAYCERPQSPMPKRKQELMTYVNSLARYHFTDPDDIQLLQKLIHDENEFILSTFDVFDSDKDHENLIDSLQRIVDKSKTMGLHLQSVTATSFYKNFDNNPWQRNTQQYNIPSLSRQHPFNQSSNLSTNQVNRPNTPSKGARTVSEGGYSRFISNIDTNIPFNFYPQQHQHQSQQMQQQQQRQVQTLNYSRDRQPSANGTEAMRQKLYVTRDSYVKSGEGYEFQPTTTVHDVALIPNYFSSGEEDHENLESRQRLVSREESIRDNFFHQPTSALQHVVTTANSNFAGNIYKTPTQNQPHLSRALNGVNINANYFYKTPATHQQQTASTNSMNDYQFSLGVGIGDHQNAIGVRDQILIQDENLDQIQEEEIKICEQPILMNGRPPKYAGQRPQGLHIRINSNSSSNPRNKVQSQSREQLIDQQQRQNLPINRQSSQQEASRQENTTNVSKPLASTTFSGPGGNSAKNSNNGSQKITIKDHQRKHRKHKIESKKHHKKHKTQQISIDSSSKSESSFEDSDLQASSSQSLESSSVSSISSAESSRERRRRRRKNRRFKDKQEQKLRRQARKDEKQLEEGQERWNLVESKVVKKNVQKTNIDSNEIDRIIKQEGIETAIRADSFVFLSYCLSENHDIELKKIFRQFMVDEDSMRLLSQLMCSCEDKLLAFFENNFSNMEIGQLNKLRKQRDGRYINAFGVFRLSKNMKKLTESLKALVQDPDESVQPKLNITNLGEKSRDKLTQQVNTRKESLKGIFEIIFHSNFSDNPDYQHLPESFEKETMPELFVILEDYKSHNDFQKLKKSFQGLARQPVAKTPSSQQIGEGLISNLQKRPLLMQTKLTQTFRSFRGAINQFLQNEKLSQSEGKQLIQLFDEQNQNLQAIWEVYVILNDGQDMLESLKVVLIILKKKILILPLKQLSAKSDNSFDRDDEQDDYAQTQSKREEEKVTGFKQATMNLISLMPTGTRNQTNEESDRRSQESPEQCENDEGVNLPIEENSITSEHSAAELSQIQNFQHTIIRKYAMTGMISYADAPAFHNLIDSKDYRMICIFEVFSQNRQEDDFLENLALIAQIIKEQEHQNSNEDSNGYNNELLQHFQHQPIEEPELVDPFLLQVEILSSERLISEEMERWLREGHEDKNKMLNSVFNTYLQTSDRPDFINSLNSLYRKHQPTNFSYANKIDNTGNGNGTSTMSGRQHQQNSEVQARQEASIPEGERDPFIMEIETLAKFGSFSKEQVEFVKKLFEQKDRKLMQVYYTYMSTYDSEDFVNSVKLLCKRKTQQA